GKLAARLLHLFGLLLCGLPILAVTQLWGGADLLTLLSGFATTASQILSLGAFAMLCSVIAQRTVQATIAAYAIPLVIGVSCVLLPALTESDWFGSRSAPSDEATRIVRLAERTAAIAAVNGVVAAFCLFFAVRELRSFASPPEPLRHPLIPLPKPE